MRLSKTQRMLAAWLGTTFLVASLGEAVGFDSCPHHDWLPDAPDPPAHHADGGHGEMHDAQASSSHHGGGSHEGACTCVGDCDINATGTPAVALFSRQLLGNPAFDSVLAADPGTPFRPAVPYRLPYANGPPRPV